MALAEDDSKPSAPENVKASASGSKTKITWDKANGAQGYVVYYATSKNGKYKKLTTVKGGSKKSTTTSKLKAGKTYYIKVRSYVKKDGKTVYSDYSKAVKYKVKK